MTKAERKWLSGLIQNLSLGIGTAIADAQISLATGTGWTWKHCLGMALFSMVSHAVAYLQKSPLPEDEA